MNLEPVDREITARMSHEIAELRNRHFFCGFISSWLAKFAVCRSIYNYFTNQNNRL